MRFIRKLNLALLLGHPVCVCVCVCVCVYVFPYFNFRRRWPVFTKFGVGIVSLNITPVSLRMTVSVYRLVNMGGGQWTDQKSEDFQTL